MPYGPTPTAEDAMLLALKGCLLVLVGIVLLTVLLTYACTRSL